ncbi:RNA polymerase sigma factor [Algicola sagamiensis]|uniref:RNA polymerase sigma factor n=1 Tax=Algicola sagamiensis TaxID=163869 RepID=UPI000366FF37|nr:sigma-70 family RNA polymerase sigma factor [Algicola sagamiensis]
MQSDEVVASSTPSHPRKTAGGQSPDVLIQAAVEGDQVALNRLLQQYQSRIFSFIQQRVKHREDVEDLVQDTLVQVQKSIGSFQHKSNFSTWVLGIALNLTRNHFNRSAQYKYDFGTEDELAIMEGDEAPEESISSDQKMAAVADAIEQLPHKLREALVLTCIENLSYEDAAQQLNVSVCNLKSRLFRARKHLRQTLGDSFEL